MPGYNKSFELTPDDLELIETALRETQRKLSDKVIGGDGGAVANTDCPISVQLRETHELLGRLHNQKKFYRPKSGAYVSG